MTRPPRPTRLAPAWAALLSCLAAGALLATRASRPPPPGDTPGDEAGQAPGLEEVIEATHRRTMAKARLDQELIQGRLTLAEAAALGVALARLPPPFDWQAYRARYPGRSAEERCC